MPSHHDQPLQPRIELRPDGDDASFSDALASAAAAAARRWGCSLSAASKPAGDDWPPASPALTVRHGDRRVAHWLAVPEGPEAAPFGWLMERLSSVAPFPPAAPDDLIRLEVYIAAACPHCPRAVGAALEVAEADPRVEVLVVDAERFPQLGEAVPVRSVPTTIVAGGTTIVGEVTAAALTASIAALTGPERDFEVLASLIANGRLDAAVEEVLAGTGVVPFGELWNSASMEGRIGLTLVAERVLDRDPAALDRIVPRLLEVLDTPEPGRRGDTVDLLGRVRHPAARRALELLRTDPDEDIAEAAAEALAVLGER